MIEVARYNFDGEKNAHWILETDEGHFVKHVDYAALAQKMAATEQDEQNTLKERDAAEDALATMYAAVMGEAPEWSNIFGYDDAIETVEMTLSALQQKLDAVLAENVVLKESRKRLGEFIIEEIDAEYPLNMEIQTPETDAILNEVRAEGVEMFANHCLKLRGEMMKTEPNEAVVNQAITTTRRAGEFALYFAAQLRTGSTEGAIHD